MAANPNNAAKGAGTNSGLDDVRNPAKMVISPKWSELVVAVSFLYASTCHFQIAKHISDGGSTGNSTVTSDLGVSDWVHSSQEVLHPPCC
jgi:hypothetical protein